MLRQPPKRQASANKQADAAARRIKRKAINTKMIPAPQPDPRLVPSGIPAISYLLALLMAAMLMLCAHITNSPPAPGDLLAMPARTFHAAGAGPNMAPLQKLSALRLGNILAASGPGCVLSEAALRAAGGSFAILAHRPDGIVLSWAGGATATANPCPAGIPLLVSQSSYQSLRAWRPAPSYQH